MNFGSLLIALKRHLTLTICGVLAAMGCVFYYVRSEQVTRLESDFRDLEISRMRMFKNLKSGRGIETHVQDMEALASQAKERLFKVDDLAGNYDYFFRIEGKSGVKLSGLQQNVKKPDERDRRSRRQRIPYQEINYEMNATGSFEQLLNFLRQVERGQAFAVVQSLNLSVAGRGETGHPNMMVGIAILGEKAGKR